MALTALSRSLSEKTNSTNVSITLLVLLYFAWRIWTFTIKPLLRPNEPKQVPYTIPFLGHALTFFRDSNKACRDARTSMGGVQDPLGMVIAGEQFYVINSPEDVTAFYNNKKTLSFDEYVQDVLVSMGCSADGMAKMTKVQPHLKKDVIHAGEDFYRLQFLPGPRFDTFWPKVHARIEAPLAKEKLLGKGTAQHSLLSLCRTALLGPTLAAIFGDAILETDPSIIETMVLFDELSWKINYKIPLPFSRDTHAARNKMIEFFKKYARLPAEKKSDMSWFMKSLQQEMDKAGLSEHDSAVFNLSVSWTALSNAFKACFWLVAYLVHDPNLFNIIQDEVRSAQPEDLHSSEANLESTYPHLISLYNETLRFNGSSVSIRTVVSSTQLGKFTVPGGSRIILPTRQLHINESAFKGSHHFQADRFMDPKLAKSAGFRPFGGGVSYCPGRYLARRELVAFVVILLSRYDIKLADPSQSQFPRLDEVKPSVGMLTPIVGDDVTLLLSSRS